VDVTSKFNELVYQYPIRIPERYGLVVRSLLTQVCVMRVCACVCGGGGWWQAGCGLSSFYGKDVGGSCCGGFGGAGLEAPMCSRMGMWV
jgi:hypothetical protein